MSLQEEIRFEQSFWLAIMRDHCQFILEALAPTEREEVKRAQALLSEFDQLVQVPFQLEESYEAASELREFKLHLLCRLLCEQIGFHLTPTFLNHMVNEVDEYLSIRFPII